MLVGAGKADTALTLCREIAARAPAAHWASRRAGYLLAAVERFEEGVAAFQTALKGDVRDAGARGDWLWVQPRVLWAGGW